MASRWPAVGASLRRRSLQNQERLEESEALQPVAGHPDTSSGALGSLCRQFQRRLPLRAVSLNLGVGPSWKRLETPEPGQQGLQAAARSAKSTLGAMSQRIQESCQSGTKWLVETQVKARRRKRGAQKGSSPPARSLSQRSTRLSVAAPAHLTLDPWEKEYDRLSVQMGHRAHPWRRSRREAAFRSPYSSAETLCSPSESDSDLEPVGAGIRHLQKVSQELDEAIIAEDRIHTSQEFLEDPGAGSAPELPQTRT
ncbi:protein PIMREG isoform X1 [Moschus berezovskii]|uniref:protein PIMREG isoform X1 n=1 Tax=Moschus berezovskii TaxID=68408 RepID=UPI002444E37E|nr:protein PIMREG isoform X1 [Moschus berezovskii]